MFLFCFTKLSKANKQTKIMFFGGDFTGSNDNYMYLFALTFLSILNPFIYFNYQQKILLVRPKMWLISEGTGIMVAVWY